MEGIDRVKKVINWLIFEKKIKTRRDLAEKLGYSESSLSQILNGKVALSDRFIKKLSIFDKNINSKWLSDGEGEMINKANHDKVNETVSMSREVFEQINRLTEQNSRLTETVLSQQNTIASLQREKEKAAARQDEHAASADAKESNVG
jgi:transcriptional regulator with XRE-family HTH domain